MPDDVYIGYDQRAHLGQNFEADVSDCRQYAYIYVQGYGVVHIKAEAEGIVVDVYADNALANEPCDTLSVTKTELENYFKP